MEWTRAVMSCATRARQGHHSVPYVMEGVVIFTACASLKYSSRRRRSRRSSSSRRRASDAHTAQCTFQSRDQSTFSPSMVYIIIPEWKLPPEQAHTHAQKQVPPISASPEERHSATQMHHVISSSTNSSRNSSNTTTTGTGSNSAHWVQNDTVASVS